MEEKKMSIFPEIEDNILKEIYKCEEITPNNSFTFKDLSKAGKLFFLYVCSLLWSDMQQNKYVNTDKVFDVSEYGLEKDVKDMISKYFLFSCKTTKDIECFATRVIIIDPNLCLSERITRVKISEDFVKNPQVRRMIIQYFA